MRSLLDMWRRLRANGTRPPEVPLFCECNDVDCLQFLPITDETYLETRTRLPQAALVLVGHEDAGDTILERHDTHVVVKGR